MRRVPRAALVFTALLSVLATTAGAAANLEATPYLAEVFTRGELLNFSLTWLRMSGGEARMRIAPHGDGHLKIESIAESKDFFAKIYPVRDVIESIVTREDFSTTRFQKTLNERNKHKTELTIIDPVKMVAIRKGKEIPVPRPLVDPLSTIYYLRTLDLTPGKKHRFTVIADGKVYPLDADVLYRETIKVEAGSFDTVVVEPKMRHGGIFRDENTRLVIWFTDDDRRIPVRIRSYLSVGTITASLESSRIGDTDVKITSVSD
jgi:uncharacterized protein DUF3108